MSHAQRLYIDIEEYETNARGGKMGNTVASMNDVEVAVCNGSETVFRLLGWPWMPPKRRS